MTDKGWYFTVTSDEYGREDYGPYDSPQEAEQGIVRIKEVAAVLADPSKYVERMYSTPQQRAEDEDNNS